MPSHSNIKERIDLEKDCIFLPFSTDLDLGSFDCDHDDLNDFFKNDALPYQDHMMGKTHAFVLSNSPSKIVCAFTVANDVLRLSDKSKSVRKAAKASIAAPKQRWPEYPAVKIGRLGVHIDYARHGVGSQLMDFIKSWFSNTQNKTGCRFITVDAYNIDRAKNYYLKNGFDYLFTTDELEIEYINKVKRGTTTNLDTKYMYFDLSRLD